MDIKIKNITGADASYAIKPQSGWQVEAVAGKIAGLAYGATSVSGMAELVNVINTLKLMRSAVGLAQSIRTILSTDPQFVTIRGGHSGGKQEDLPPLQVSTLFSPGFWQDIFHARTLTMFIFAETEYGPAALSFDVSAVYESSWTIEAKGVREGIDGLGKLHRWGEGGVRAPFNGAPSVVWFKGQYHMFVLAESGGSYSSSAPILHAVSPNGLVWTQANPFDIGIRASSSPCAVVYDNTTEQQLHVFYRDPTGLAIYDVFSSDGANFGASTRIGLDCDGAMSACQFQGNLHCVGRDGGGKNGVMYARWVPSVGHWESGYTGNYQNTSGDPIVVPFRDRLHLFYRDGAGNAIDHGSSGDHGLTWQVAAPNNIGVDTDQIFCAAVYGGQLKLFYVEAGSLDVRCIRSSDGWNFSRETDDSMGLQCAGGLSALVTSTPDGQEACLLVGRYCESAYVQGWIVSTFLSLDKEPQPLIPDLHLPGPLPGGGGGPGGPGGILI